jgi:hypothetical protein
MRDDDLDPVLIRRRQQKAKAQQRLVITGVALVALLLVGGIVAAVAISRGNRQPAVPGQAADPGRGLSRSASDTDGWTYKEMHAHLRGKGLRWAYWPTSEGIYLVDATEDQEIRVAVNRAEHNIQPAGAVEVRQMKDTESARQQAGRTRRAAFDYGRWVFIGDPEMVAKIKGVLGG